MESRLGSRGSKKLLCFELLYTVPTYFFLLFPSRHGSTTLLFLHDVRADAGLFEKHTPGLKGHMLWSSQPFETRVVHHPPSLGLAIRSHFSSKPKRLVTLCGSLHYVLMNIPWEFI